MLVLFCSAAAALIYEVVATATVFFYYPESSYSVATVLSVFLLGLGLGSLGVHVLRHKLRRTALTLGLAQLIVGGYGYFILRELLVIGDQWSGLSLLGLSAVMLFVPAVFLGATFPLAAALVPERQRNALGLIYAIDLAGAISGSLLAGMLFIPWWGYSVTLGVAALLNVMASILIVPRMMKFVPTALGALILSLMVWTTAPTTAPAEYDMSDVRRPSAHGEITIVDSVLSIDGRVQCAYHQADQTSERQIMNAALTDFDREASLSILNIGLGCGNTATQALRWPGVEITVAEINSTIIDLTTARVAALSSPRVTITHEDGLAYVRDNTASYDAIIIDIENPAVAHASPLYTLEAFETFARHLGDQGRLAVWDYEASSAQPDRYRDIIAYTLGVVLPYVYHADGFFVAARHPLPLQLYEPTSAYELNTADQPNLTAAYLGT